METDIIHELVEIRSQLRELSDTIYTEWGSPYRKWLDTKTEVQKKDQLYAALALAKMDYKPLVYNRVNEFNKQVYSDLQAILQATTAALSKNGLVFIQQTPDEDGTTFLYSTLGHSSGQEITCKSRIILQANTGAKSDNQRFGESLAIMKRRVAESMLGIAARGDGDDNDDADASAYLFNTVSTKAMAGDETPAQVDQGIFVEKITKDQLNELHMELADYPMMTKALLKGLEINSLSDMPKAKYLSMISHIRSQKIKLMNAPKKEW